MARIAFKSRMGMRCAAGKSRATGVTQGLFAEFGINANDRWTLVAFHEAKGRLDAETAGKVWGSTRGRNLIASGLVEIVRTPSVISPSYRLTSKGRQVALLAAARDKRGLRAAQSRPDLIARFLDGSNRAKAFFDETTPAGRYAVAMHPRIRARGNRARSLVVPVSALPKVVAELQASGVVVENRCSQRWLGSAESRTGALPDKDASDV